MQKPRTNVEVEQFRFDSHKRSTLLSDRDDSFTEHIYNEFPTRWAWFWHTKPSNDNGYEGKASRNVSRFRFDSHKRGFPISDPDDIDTILFLYTVKTRAKDNPLLKRGSARP